MIEQACSEYIFFIDSCAWYLLCFFRKIIFDTADDANMSDGDKVERRYESPELTCYGNVTEITTQGRRPSGSPPHGRGPPDDVPRGPR